MEMELFSNTLPFYDVPINNNLLLDTLNTLMEKVGASFRIVKWSDDFAAVPVKLEIDLPTHGNFRDIDIRKEEHVLLVFDIHNYPSKAPKVFSDRMDFPKDKLAHLYVAVKGFPPAFCYVKGDRDSWYANKRIDDLLIRISNWLRDAASGELTENGEQFEPLRLEAYSGTIIYDYDLLATIVHKKKSFINGQNFAIGLFNRDKTEKKISFILNKMLTDENTEEILKEYFKEKVKDKEAADKIFHHFGYILWSDSEKSFPDYEIDLPSSWSEFKTFCDLYEIDYTSLEVFISTYDFNYSKYFPVIVGIRRPLNLIGFSSNIEFVNFRFQIGTPDVNDGKISDTVAIAYQVHNQPLTTVKAKIISGFQVPAHARKLVFGCGALGSKIVMHFARSGETEFTLVDPDELSPHNFVRHALDGGYVGKNKAEALEESINRVFPHENIGIIAGPSFKDGLFEQESTFEKYPWIFNFTASEALFNRLVMAENMSLSQICSGSISDFGNLGILLKEGQNRNPRIDDLRAYLYSLYKNNSFISDWLGREQAVYNDKNLTVIIGVGCNSETTVLSDDKVSSHAAYFTGAIRHLMNSDNPSGRIYLNRIIDDSDQYQTTTNILSVKPFEVMNAENDQSWSIRFKSGILDNVKKQMRDARHRETGGILTGTVNYKNKTIHVVDLVSAPPDSSANSVCFHRGCNGLPEIIDRINFESGGQIGYVGEWHSHPRGPEQPSDTDMHSVARFKKELAHLVTPLPVFLMIVTPKAILPFVY